MKELFKYPSLLISFSTLGGLLIGFGSAWATQVSRIDSLERTFNSAKEAFVTKDQLQVILERIKGLDEKIDTRFEVIEKFLKH